MPDVCEIACGEVAVAWSGTDHPAMIAAVTGGLKHG
jgi:hypothetical protein